jgi:hypothetical protein
MRGFFIFYGLMAIATALTLGPLDSDQPRDQRRAHYTGVVAWPLLALGTFSGMMEATDED